MYKGQDFEHTIDLTVMMLATEELANLTGKTAAQLRSELIEQALTPYLEKLPEGYGAALTSLREQWVEQNLPKMQRWSNVFRSARCD